MKLRLRLLISAFIVSFLFVAGLSLLSIGRFTQMQRQNAQVDHSFQVVRHLSLLHTGLQDLEIHEKDFLLTHDSSYQKRFLADKAQLDLLHLRLTQLLHSNREQLNHLILLKAGIASRTDIGWYAMQMPDSESYSGRATLFTKEQLLNQECLQLLQRMDQAAARKLSLTAAQRNTDQRMTSYSLKYLSVLLGLLMLTLFLLLLREFRRRSRYQDALQEKVTELQRSRSELQQIAYVASHDLQEPLRKIRLYTDRLKHPPAGNKPPPPIHETLDRIHQYTHQMQELVSDLMNLTSLVNNAEPPVRLMLQEAVDNALDALRDQITAKAAILHHCEMPIITGYPFQLFILFRSILDNALKFSRDGVRPLITISYAQVRAGELSGLGTPLPQEGFHCISISDNGIGFHNKFSEKIFQIFQRLHSQEDGYSGKGIGLAICQRIMVNHKGHILAYGHPNSGSTFKLYFPVTQTD